MSSDPSEGYGSPKLMSSAIERLLWQNLAMDSLKAFHEMDFDAVKLHLKPLVEAGPGGLWYATLLWMNLLRELVPGLANASADRPTFFKLVELTPDGPKIREYEELPDAARGHHYAAQVLMTYLNDGPEAAAATWRGIATGAETNIPDLTIALLELTARALPATS